MNTEEIADAILKLAQDRELRLQMGENGYRRVMAGYRLEQMQEAYRKIYHSFAAELPEAWTEEAPPCASS
jgi:polysaccharide biosynthesis protein PelF